MPQIISISTEFIIVILSFLNVQILLKKWRNDKLVFGAVWFWVFSAAMWFCGGFVVVFWLTGREYLSKISAYGVFIFLIFMILSAINYFSSLVFRKKVFARILFWFSVFLSIFYFYFLFTFGLLGPFVSEWGGSEYTESAVAYKIGRSLLTIAAILIVFDFLKRIFNWLRSRKLQNSQLLWVDCALISYAVAGSVDLSDLVGFPLFLVRIIIIVSFLVIYLTYCFTGRKKTEKELEI